MDHPVPEVIGYDTVTTHHAQSENYDRCSPKRKNFATISFFICTEYNTGDRHNGKCEQNNINTDESRYINNRTLRYSEQ